MANDLMFLKPILFYNHLKRTLYIYAARGRGDLSTREVEHLTIGQFTIGQLFCNANSIVEVEGEGFDAGGRRGEVASASGEAEVDIFCIVEHGARALVLEDVARVDGGGRKDTRQVAVGEDVGNVVGVREFGGAGEVAGITVLGIDDIGRASFKAGGWRQRQQVTVKIVARICLQSTGQISIERQNQRADLVGR